MISLFFELIISIVEIPILVYLGICALKEVTSRIFLLSSTLLGISVCRFIFIFLFDFYARYNSGPVFGAVVDAVSNAAGRLNWFALLAGLIFLLTSIITEEQMAVVHKKITGFSKYGFAIPTFKSQPRSVPEPQVYAQNGTQRNQPREFKVRKSGFSITLNLILFLIIFLPVLFLGGSLAGSFLGNGIVVFVFFAAIAVWLYLLPTFISHTGRKIVIFIFNVLMGWTLIGWIILIFFALSGNKDERHRQELHYMVNRMNDH